MSIRKVRVKSYFDAFFSALSASRPAGREVEVFPNDTFVVSYLRSGSTWVRFLLANLLHPGQQVTFVNLKYLLPSIYDFPNHKLRSLPRVLKSHEPFDPRYQRVLHLVRDPRDVAVSCYYFYLKTRVLPDGFPLEDFLARFLEAKVVDYADRLGTWQEHSLSWSRTRGATQKYLLVRYEDLVRQPAMELAKVASFMGWNISLESMQCAINASSGEKLRSLERQQWKKWGVTKDSRGDIPFVREANCGAWKKHLSPAGAGQIERMWGGTMGEFGYGLSDNGGEPAR
jgi:hypothetical protein